MSSKIEKTERSSGVPFAVQRELVAVVQPVSSVVVELAVSYSSFSLFSIVEHVFLVLVTIENAEHFVAQRVQLVALVPVELPVPPASFVVEERAHRPAAWPDAENCR